jgi:hypothetical protein
VRWTEHGASIAALAKRWRLVMNSGRSRRARHGNDSFFAVWDNSTDCGRFSRLLDFDAWSAVEAFVVLVESGA